MNDEATRGLGERLLAYEGKTLNHEPKPSRPQGGVEHELATMLSQRWEAIVGKIPLFAGRVIPEITANELAQFYFEVNVAEKYYRQAFVAAINEKGEWLVYDVTGEFGACVDASGSVMFPTSDEALTMGRRHAVWLRIGENTIDSLVRRCHQGCSDDKLDQEDV